jgi:N-acetylmuramoyl-L-alanine amidase
MNTRKFTNRVVVHHSLTDTGDVDSFRRHHMKPKPEGLGAEDIGYHFVILPCGDLQQGRRQELQGAHAKGRNFDSIGVCLIGNFSKYSPTTSQLKTFINLYTSLCKRYGKDLPIEFHRSENLKNACPGVYLEREVFLNMMYGKDILQKKYSIVKSAKKGSEAPITIVGATAVLIFAMRKLGIEISENEIPTVGVVVSALYGVYRAVRNWVKNRHN